MADIVPEYAAVIDSRELSRWYEHARRDLPWRREGVTPWQILVSEFMLQQTPVARVDGLAGVGGPLADTVGAAAARGHCCGLGASSVIRGGQAAT
jgi:hypothetical protein